MFDPLEARLWAETVAQMVAHTETTLITIIRDSAARDLGAPRYATRRVAEIATIRARLEQVMGRDWQAVLDHAQTVLDLAREAGQGQAIRDLKTAGLSPYLPAQMGQALQVVAFDTLKALTLMPAIALRDATDVYQHVISRHVADQTLGADTRINATQRALDDFARRGITGFIDRAGRNWKMDVYAEMAVRTGTSHAMLYGWTRTMQAGGRDLMIVSDHPYECPLCRPWEGKILSISGQQRGTVKVGHALNPGQHVNVRVAGSLKDATDQGLWHPNCGHTAGLYIPGVTKHYKPTTSEQGYEAMQQQRAHEREIRRLKRMRAAQLNPNTPASGEIGRKIRANQAAIRDILTQWPELPRKRVREQIYRAH